MADTTCPGCRVRLPESPGSHYDGGFNASKECWDVFTQVIAVEFENAVLFGRVHQLTVDGYAAQHPGGQHRDKSIDVHLCGLHLALERGIPPTEVPAHLQRLAGTVREWPHWTPPDDLSKITVRDVALAGSVEEHATLVLRWTEFVWSAWSAHHDTIRQFVESNLGTRRKSAR